MKIKNKQKTYRVFGNDNSEIFLGEECKFALIGTVEKKRIICISFSYCREVIHDWWVVYKNTKHIVSYYKLNDKITKIEEKLKLKTRTKQLGLIKKQGGGYLFLIYVSPFWRKNGLFKSLFTAILNGDNYFKTRKEKMNLKAIMNGKIKFDSKFNQSQWRDANFLGLEFKE